MHWLPLACDWRILERYSAPGRAPTLRAVTAVKALENLIQLGLADPLSFSATVKPEASTATVTVVALKGEEAGPVFDRAGIIRTAKKIMAGEIYVPAQLLDPA